MQSASLQCRRMARVATEYCDLIDGFDGVPEDGDWLPRVKKLLPRLHVAVIALAMPQDVYRTHRLPDDNQRCELYLSLHERLLTDPVFQQRFGAWALFNTFSERLADNFTDIYFDLKHGLGLFQQLPAEPERAVSNWLCGFYMHWGQHLLDAECCLRILDLPYWPAVLPEFLAGAYEDQNHRRD
jgi:hypothetical protein